MKLFKNKKPQNYHEIKTKMMWINYYVLILFNKNL